MSQMQAGACSRPVQRQEEPPLKNCPHRSECACIPCRSLCYAVCRSREKAQQLNEEGDRLLSGIANASDICSLLDRDQAAEQGLSRVLRSELALIGYLCAQSVPGC